MDPRQNLPCHPEGQGETKSCIGKTYTTHEIRKQKTRKLPCHLLASRLYGSVFSFSVNAPGFRAPGIHPKSPAERV